MNHDNDLERFFQEQSDEHANILFELLFERYRREIIGYLYAKGLRNEDLEDRLQETRLRTWHKFSDLRRTGRRIKSFVAYVKTIARNLYIDIDVRGRHPARTKLVAAVKMLLNPHDCPGTPYAYWGASTNPLCGLDAWRRDAHGGQVCDTPNYLAIQNEDYAAFEEYWKKGVSSDRTMLDDLPLFLAYLFRWLDTPLPLNDLVYHLTRLLGIGENEVIIVSQMGEEDQMRMDMLADRREDDIARLIAQDAVRQAMNEMSPIMQAIVYLGMARVDLVRLTEAHMPIENLTHTLACALKIPYSEAQKKATVAWSGLPMDSKAIALHLGVETNYVYQLRNTAHQKIKHCLKN